MPTGDAVAAGEEDCEDDVGADVACPAWNEDALPAGCCCWCHGV